MGSPKSLVEMQSPLPYPHSRDPVNLNLQFFFECPGLRFITNEPF